MDDDSKSGVLLKWGVGVTGLGALAAAIGLPRLTGRWDIGIYVAVAIIILFLLIFGSYYLWQKLRARKQSRAFSSAIEAQTAAAPKAISDPNKKADLDRLRQKFQTGMQEFRSRGKDIYKLPWYVIIGESGSGKTEAIRHSGIEFPPGLQDELQGSGGTVNMDWWFTNRGIILDTAGSMLFREAQAGEAPEWREFLRLLKKARTDCPVNGLFLVLSIESLIKDSAEKIAEKATKLAQQLDLIQRTLDVRFPVYLIVTKADLLTGFREFFDNIDDPLLQHQMFGWSNPEPLDAAFRPEQVEQHLKSVAQRLRRRRLALLLKESAVGAQTGDTSHFYAGSAGSAANRRLDEVDSMFALPESVMRLVPRLQRYLERVFVAGEWSAKPVFLRGIYFTSSMREGKALDEAIALATGLSVDQLPEDRTWEKNRAFFLRDLFVEKVFRESGLVTRAPNTIQLLRKRRLTIFGTAGVAMLLVVVFGILGRSTLRESVGKESQYWDWAAATNAWIGKEWTQAIVRAPSDGTYRFTYAGDNQITVGAETMTLVEYHRKLKDRVTTGLATPLLFRPLRFMSGDEKQRKGAQRILFEKGVVEPLVMQTRNKMQGRSLDASDARTVDRHRDALLSLIRFETDHHGGSMSHLEGSNAAVKYLNSFVSYLTDTNATVVDTNLAEVLAWTYSQRGTGAGLWPPKALWGGDSVSNNPAIKRGLEDFKLASRKNLDSIKSHELPKLNEYADALKAYRELETQWLAITNTENACDNLTGPLSEAAERVRGTRLELLKAATNIEKPVTNLAVCYAQLAAASSRASKDSFTEITAGLPDSVKTGVGLVREILNQLEEFNREAALEVTRSLSSRSNAITVLDADYLAELPGKAGSSLGVMRLDFYIEACGLMTGKAAADEQSMGDRWQKFVTLNTRAAGFRKKLESYKGAYENQVLAACDRIAGQADRQLKEEYVGNYVRFVTNYFQTLAGKVRTFQDVTNAQPWLARVADDLAAKAELAEQAAKLGPVAVALTNAYRQIPQNYVNNRYNNLRQGLKFPVLLESPEVFNAEGLQAVRKTLAGLAGELTNPAWGSFPGSDTVLASARANPYDEVVGALVTPDGLLAEIEILFTPPVSGAGDSGLYSGALRYAKVTIGAESKDIMGGTRPGDVSSFRENVSTPIATKIPVNTGFRIAFFNSGRTNTASVGFEGGENNWTLIRLIKARHAERLGSTGTEWKLKVPVTVNGEARTLEAFTVRVSRPLPKREAWPK